MKTEASVTKERLEMIDRFVPTRIERAWRYAPAAAVALGLCALCGCEPERQRAVTSENSGSAGVDAGDPRGDDALMDNGPEGEGTASAPQDAGRGEADAGMPSTGSHADACSDQDAGPCCEVDAECDDQVACNGRERCVGGFCLAGTPTCPPEHPCLPETDECDCSKPDHDQDDAIAQVCDTGDGDHEVDCDDANRTVHPNAIETCDALGVDEDCNPETIGERDDDGDGYVAAQCWNPGSPVRGDDCDDQNPFAHPNRTEECDYFDNNCNGYVDERFLDGTPEPVDFGAREAFYLDADGDGCAEPDAPMELACPHPAPAHYVAADRLCDCDDEDAEVHDKAGEQCDGADNDCDGLIDGADPDLHTPDFTDTVVECNGETFEITRCPAGRLWCDQSTIQYGCDTDATRMRSCGACQTDCKFSCGYPQADQALGCDELEHLALGDDFSCGLTQGGVVACWGRGAEGRLGTDSLSRSAVPLQSVLPRGATQIAAGDAHACAIVGPRAAIYCWGRNTSLQLGTGDAGEFSQVPVSPVFPESAQADGVPLPARDISLGSEHSCAVLANGNVLCWGQSAHGRLGDLGSGEGAVIASPVMRQDVLPGLPDDAPPLYTQVQDARAVALGARHGCIITRDDTVRCWGDNALGQLGDGGDAAETDYAKDVAGLAEVSALAAGDHHTCALAAGEVYCWGDNTHGQLGRDPGEQDMVPQPVKGLSDVEQIALGYAFSCARSARGDVWCWGNGNGGQLGTQDPLSCPVSEEQRALLPPLSCPVPTLLMSDAIEIAARDHACARKHSGQAYCWGYNFYGELGSGLATEAYETTPLPVSALSASKP